VTSGKFDIPVVVSLDDFGSSDEAWNPPSLEEGSGESRAVSDVVAGAQAGLVTCTDSDTPAHPSVCDISSRGA